jgi:hypothetical protein
MRLIDEKALIEEAQTGGWDTVLNGVHYAPKQR